MNSRMPLSQPLMMSCVHQSWSFKPAVRFYNKRGTAEQVKEGKQAV
jgi:hypothetical protein